MSSAKRIAILQSNYVPWKGYFDIIRSVDEFVLYDEVQYTKNDWRNRNKIKTSNGLTWLTIPVRAERLHQTISETSVADPAWAGKHAALLTRHYSQAPGAELLPALHDLYASVPSGLLSEINEYFLRAICAMLGIATPITRSDSYQREQPDRTDRLIEICRKAGAATYVSGPAAKGYLDQSKFEAARIEIAWFDYAGYRPYEQLYPPYEHGVSILDLLLCTGSRAAEHLQRPDTQLRSEQTCSR